MIDKIDKTNKIRAIDLFRQSDESEDYIKKELERNPKFLKAYAEMILNYKSVFGMMLDPKDSSDRLLHYNLDRLKTGVGVNIKENLFSYSKKNKIDPGSKYIMPFYDTIVLGTDVAATLGMGYPIPRIFEEYIMKADRVQITGEDTDAAKNASAMCVRSKRIYAYTMCIDHMCYDKFIKKGVNKFVDLLLEEYYKHDPSSDYVHCMTDKQMAKAILLNLPVLTVQMHNEEYKGQGSCFEDNTIPHYYDVMEFMRDTPKINSVEHQEQIKRVLLKLESEGNVFHGLDREQDFPLSVEDWVDEYNKRDLDYILSN